MIIDSIKSLFSRDKKRPLVGDPIWWAPKGEKCVVTEIHSDGSFVFQGGPVVRNKNGRQVPRWTVAAASAVWRPDLGVWICGEGRTPKVGRNHQVIYPDPVAISGKATGSFSVGP